MALAIQPNTGFSFTLALSNKQLLDKHRFVNPMHKTKFYDEGCVWICFLTKTDEDKIG